LAGFLVVFAPQAVRGQQMIPAFIGGRGGTERQFNHPPAPVIPAAKGFEAVVPIVLVSFPHGQPAQARQVFGHARRQRVPFPIIPRIMAKRALQDFRVEHVQGAAELFHGGNRLAGGTRQALT